MNRWISILAVGVVAVAAVFLTKWGPPVEGVERLREILLSFGPWAVVISASLMVVQAVVAPLPANVITITNGLVFGPVWGGLLSWTTILLGATLCFSLSKGLGRPFASRIVGRSLQTAERFFDRYGLHAIFVVRITPFVPFDAVSYGAGLVGVPYFKFLLATAVGIIPSVIIYSYLGTFFASAFWWIVLGAAALSLASMWAAMRYLRRNRAAQAPIAVRPATGD